MSPAGCPDTMSSTKYMIDSLIHQTRPLHVYLSEDKNTLPAILTANQWGLWQHCWIHVIRLVREFMSNCYIYLA